MSDPLPQRDSGVRFHIRGGLLSRTFGKWHAIGPYLYIEHGGFLLHLYLRYFRLPYQHGVHRGYSLRVRDRYVHARRRRVA